MTAPILVVHDLSVTFPDDYGGLDALDSASFSVQPQEFVCVLGPPAAANPPCCVSWPVCSHPLPGRITFSTGQPRIGMVFQQANLMPWRTTIENITPAARTAGRSGRRGRVRVPRI